MDEERLRLNQEQLHIEIGGYIDILYNAQHEDRGSRDSSLFVNALVKLPVVIQDFEPSPQFLDNYLATYIDKLSHLYLYLKNKQYDVENPFFKDDKHTIDAIIKNGSFASGVADVIYSLSKIRGFKIITNYFSSDIYLTKTLLDLKERQDISDNEHFLILLWLSTTVLVPFELKRVLPDFAQRIYTLSIQNLKKYTNGSKNQVVSLILFSRLLTRKDQAHMLDDYIILVVDKSWATMHPTDKLGHLMTVNKIMKRSTMFSKYFLIIESILQIDFEILASEGSSKSEFTNLNVLYIIKLSDRLCSFYLKQGEANSSKYNFVSKVVNSFFHDILTPLEEKFDSALRYALARALSNICTSLSVVAVNYHEQVVQFILEGFDIPNLDLDQYSPNLIINEDMVSVSRYHTFLLTLGYLSLKKSLSTRFIPPVLSIVHRSIYFTQKKLTVTIGGQIRDSSCFVLWALFRSITSAVFEQFPTQVKEQLFIDVLNVCLFDQDLVIRRCGIAVLQEFIGRFGTFIFHGDPEIIGQYIVEFIQLFDAQSVATLNLSYEMVLTLSLMGFDCNVFIPTFIEKIAGHSSFDVKMLCSDVLTRLLHCPPTDKFISFDKIALTFDNVLLEMSALLANGNQDEVGPLYAVSMILESMNQKLLEPQKKTVESIVDITFKRFQFNFHSDKPEKAIEFIKFLGCYPLQMVRAKSPLFLILKLSYNEQVVNALQQLFSLVDIPEDWFNYFLVQIRNNNINLACSIGHTKGNIPLYLLVEIVCDRKSVKAETRALLQDSLSYYFPKIADISEVIAKCITDLLDDYTTTIQGDVGSKVRKSTIELIHNNITLIQSNSSLTEEIILKLVRIIAEPLSGLQMLSIKTLHLLLDRSTHKLDTIYTTDAYYRYIVTEFYKEFLVSDDLQISFWQGFVFSTGGSSSTSTINSSMSSLLEFLRCKDEPELSKFTNQILKLLIIPSATEGGIRSVSPRTLKRYQCALNLLVLIFESNSIRKYGDFEKIYIRCYNLHINTKNLNRVNLVLKVFQHLAPRLDKCLGRLVWLAFQHENPTVREMAAEALYEVASELELPDLCNKIVTIRWSSPIVVLKQHRSDIKTGFERHK